MNQHARTMRSNQSTMTSFVGVMTIVLIVISFTTAVASQYYVAEQYVLISQTVCFGASGIMMGITYVGMLVIQRFRR